MRRTRNGRERVFALALTLCLAGCGAPAGAPSATPVTASATTTAVTPASPSPAPGGAPSVEPEPTPSPEALPLAGRTIVVDPGHQLGNRNFPAQVNALVDAGMGRTKPCNTTGTATDGGIPEATVNWEVAVALRAELEALGAQVLMTREDNSDAQWGPCIDVRGSWGNGQADVLVSLHADGADAQAHGFHLLVPGSEQATHDASVLLAQEVRGELEAAGLVRATYVADALRASDDYGTLNASTVPAVILEMGNMRNADDALRLTTPADQGKIAAAVSRALVGFLAG